MKVLLKEHAAVFVLPDFIAALTSICEDEDYSEGLS